MLDIFVDIETIPTQSPEYKAKVREGIKPPGNIKKPESVAAWLAENADTATDEVISKTSFDPAAGHICCIGFAFGTGKVQYYEARSTADEAPMLDSFFQNVKAECNIGMARWIGHYISGFDLRFLINRAIVLGVQLPPSIILPRDSKPWGDQVFDTMAAWAGAKGTISQDNLARALGLPGKGDFDGSMVAKAWANGEYARIATYCMSDVETVRNIYRRFEAVGY